MNLNIIHFYIAIVILNLLKIFFKIHLILFFYCNEDKNFFYNKKYNTSRQILLQIHHFEIIYRKPNKKN